MSEGTMVEAEGDQRLTKLEEAMLVQARIIDRIEQSHDEEISELRGALVTLAAAVDRTNGTVEKLSADVLIMNSSMSGLLERIDKFIQRLESNGRNN